MLKHAHSLSYDQRNLEKRPARTLRSSTNTYLKTQIPKTRKYERSFVHQSIRIWNLLGEDLKQTRDLRSFKTRVKSELLQNNLNFPELGKIINLS